tara:strand:- start:3566 stop:4036 length:471 start_codon:yes stop_codon:yes gene_type:complete
MKTKKIITVEELGLIKYQDLKAKFAELGVPQVWRAGSKKEELIKKAVAILSKVTIEDSKSNVTEIKNTEIQDTPSDIQVLPKLNTENKEIPNKENNLTVLVKPFHKDPYNYAQHSKVILTQLLKTINLNLMNNIPAQRDVLLFKMNLIEKALEAKE